MYKAEREYMLIYSVQFANLTICTFQLSDVQEYVTIGTCWSVYKAEMQNVKVVYFTESTITVIAKYFTFLFTK